MPQPVIHQDIIDQVTYELWDDRAALLQCSTVSHSFLIPHSEPQAPLLRHRGPSFQQRHEPKQPHPRPLHPS